MAAHSFGEPKGNAWKPIAEAETEPVVIPVSYNL